MESSSNKPSAPRVLYLDDNTETCALVKTNLEKSGVSVDISPSSAELDLDKVRNYSLVIADSRLTGPKNGLEVIRHILEHNSSCDCILVTEARDEGILTEALQLGVFDVVPKNGIFIQNLVHVASRVLETRKKDQEILATKLKPEVFSLLGEILDSAQIDHWVFNNLNPLENRFPVMFFQKLGIQMREFSTFWQNIPPRQRYQLFKELQKAEKARRSFEVMIPFSSSTLLWLRIRGAFDPKVAGRSYGIVLDETNSVMNEKKLAETLQQREEISKRLQLSVVEIHHRVKNSFQMMISLLNMQLRGKDTLDRDAVNNISRHLYGLSSIHDLLTFRTGESHPAEEINVKELIGKLTSNLPLNASERLTISCDEIYVSPRVASTFAVIANELLMNGIKHGSGAIEVSCQVRPENSCRVTFANYIEAPIGISDFEKSKHGAGIRLVKFLSKADLKQEARWHIEGCKITTEFVLPVLSAKCGT